MVRLLTLSVCLLALAGCASSAPTVDGTQAPSQGESVIVKAAQLKAGVVDFEMADLQEASRIAHDANDVLAYQCFDYLVTVVPKVDDHSNGKIDGPATAFMRTRLAVKRINEGPSDELKANCAALYLDAKDDVTGLAGKIAALAAKLGIKGFSPL